jgi:hypothetical protein
MKNTPPKNKPVSEDRAKEIFEMSQAYEDAFESFMESKGYRWSNSENMYIDDGSLAMEWADRVNDERKGN